MAMTQTGLVILGALATLATAGLFKQFADRWTGVALSFSAALLWGIMGISAFDVRMRSTADPNLATDEPILPLAYTGIGLAMVVFVFAIYELKQAWAGETESISADGLP